MKAFQLKIAIKDSKPPIWRRIIVPAGITFSQLGMILNEAMGWSGEHLFEFEFYHLNLRILEDSDEYFGFFGSYDCAEAKNTYIREYLEDNDWFYYIYDMGDCWQHRVTVEKILTDYAYDYPQVIKFKGNCPPEDCGGLWRYYELMDILNDKTHPEYEERMEWLEMCEYPNEYDINAVNDTMQKYYFYKWGKGEKRSQMEISKDFYSGNYGLCATKKDNNIAREYTTEEKLQDIAQMWQDIFGMDEEEDFDEVWEKPSLAEILVDFELDDLRELAADKGIKGASGCSKKVLVNKLTKHILKSEIMESYFVCLSDREIEAFERAIASDCPVEVPEEEIGVFIKLYNALYIGMLMDETYMVSKEVAEAYERLKGAEFEQKRQKISWLWSCLEAAVLLYGIAPLKVVQKLLSMNTKVQISEAEIYEAVENFPPEFANYVLTENKLYHKELYPDDRGLLKKQRSKAYYIPNKKEIEELSVFGHISDNNSLEALKVFMLCKLGIEAFEADILVAMIHLDMMHDRKVAEILEDLFDAGIAADNDKIQIEFIMHLCHLWNNTRMVVHRGFTPKELGLEITAKEVLLQL